MPIIKITKDYFARVLQGGADRLLGTHYVPEGLYELDRYFRREKGINFEYYQEEGVLIAVSTNFRHGSIVTHGKNEVELDINIRDAIITSFNIPSSYSKEVKLYKVGEKKMEYALT